MAATVELKCGGLLIDLRELSELARVAALHWRQVLSRLWQRQTDLMTFTKGASGNSSWSIIIRSEREARLVCSRVSERHWLTVHLTTDSLHRTKHLQRQSLLLTTCQCCCCWWLTFLQLLPPSIVVLMFDADTFSLPALFFLCFEPSLPCRLGIPKSWQRLKRLSLSLYFGTNTLLCKVISSTFSKRAILKFH